MSIEDRKMAVYLSGHALRQERVPGAYLITDSLDLETEHIRVLVPLMQSIRAFTIVLFLDEAVEIRSI